MPGPQPRGPIPQRPPRTPRGPFTQFDLALPSVSNIAFSAPGWIFEMKYDGHRCLSSRFESVQMISIEGRDIAEYFPQLVAELQRLPAGTVLDGELLMVDEEGRPEYDRLLGQTAIARSGAVRGMEHQPATLVCWDILMWGGEDLRAHPLLARKAALGDLIRGMERIWYAGHVEEAGRKMYDEAEFLGLEGIVAKRADSRYTAGRTKDWLVIDTPTGLERENGWR